MKDNNFKIVKTKSNELALFPSSTKVTISQIPYGSDSQEGILQEFFNKIDLIHILGAWSPLSILVKNINVECRVYEEGIYNYRNEIVCNQHKNEIVNENE